MDNELITCSACGTKNASHRTVCLSCGGDLPTSKDGAEPASQPLVKWVRSSAKNLNTPTKWSISALFVVGVYFGLTWFFFGSSHPCGILEARERPYVVNRYRDNALELLLSMGKTPSLGIMGQFVEGLRDAPKNAVHDLHERIWNHYTPAGCLWEALAWNPDPYKGSPPLRVIRKAGE